ncbi:PRC-barrel domain containing protein [Dietzia aerolata]|uniref:PRC-barrel domain-containing protein n=1 Tax=Dietzia aerolata TaxID=595984 RepID=A0ABV5JT01_9ACTN|nr:PRC-barrel domain containing protein [Dietzia aerolata]
MNLKEQLDALLDATAFDSTGTKVGSVRQVYVDDASGKLTFATVSTGIFSADAIVPLHGARLLDSELHLDHTRSVIRDSPRPDNTEDALTPDQEVKLLEYYGIEAPQRGRDTAATKPGMADPKKPDTKRDKPAEKKSESTTERPKSAPGSTSSSSSPSGTSSPTNAAPSAPKAAPGTTAAPKTAPGTTAPKAAPSTAAPKAAETTPEGGAAGDKGQVAGGEKPKTGTTTTPSPSSPSPAGPGSSARTDNASVRTESPTGGDEKTSSPQRD